MKVVKPSRLSLLHRSFDFYSENFLGVAAIGLIDLGLCPKILSEINVWKCVESELNSNPLCEVS